MRAKWLVALGLAAIVMAVVVGYLIRRATSTRGLPSADSPAYEETTRSFYRGLAQLQVGLLDDAKREFARATELAPGEPAAWANLGIAHLRLGEFDAAVAPIATAAALMPRQSDVALLQGQLETSRGRLDEGIAHLRRAVDLDRGGLRARYALAEEIERAGGANADAQAQQLLEQILELRPDNLAVVLERARLSAKRGDVAALVDSMRRLDTVSAGWPAPAVEQYRALQQAVEARNFTDGARGVAFLRNVLVRVTTFRESLAAVRTPSELIAEPFERFLRLPSPSAQPSARDEALTFTREPLGAASPASPALVLVTALDDSGTAVILAADGRELRRIEAVAGPFQGRGGGAEIPAPQVATFPGGASVTLPTANGVLALDWNRDFKMDLALAGRGGLRLLTQQADGAFADVTAKAAGTAAGMIAADCFGVWTADIEMDGDLDLIVGVIGAAPVVLRNNGDGTWRRMQPFTGVVGLRAFAWGDLDGDGDPDAALVGEHGDLHLFENRQGGQFREMATPNGLGTVVALALGDVTADGVLRVVTLDATGAIRVLSQDRLSPDRKGWEQQTLGMWPDPIDPSAVGRYRMFLADVDNNGALDLLVSGPGRSRIWLGDESNKLRPFESPALQGTEVFSVVDLNGDGQLDLVGLADGQPVRLFGRGTKNYHWLVMRPRAQPTAGDQRINSFAVGAEIEIRSGLLTEKQILAGEPAHFGLGTRTGIDVARIVWPNGIMQADFDRKADQVVVAEQRLKGSCPWVFAYDGAGMRFVTDFLWRSPLGLRINAQDTAGVTQTEDWVKIRGDQLVPRDGVYDVRITAELWETHFIDHLSLMVVDHKDVDEVFVDERFAREAPALAVHAMTHPHAIARAWDDAGRDVTDLVAKQDGRYLATFARGPYQGIAQDHFVEIELAEALSRDLRQHQWLVANGWIYPTDSSINVAIGQAGIVPRGLSLEAQDRAGRWVVIAPDLGFPAGKNKTILIDLGRVGRAGVTGARRLRLRTNLEIYWDSLAVADAAESDAHAGLETTRLAPDRAELRYRGFSKTGGAKRDVPETPRYDEVANLTQRWRDLIGYYTRFGDVRELLAAVDDRYVIMNAGDELQLRFAAPAPPRPGWTRDFVLIGDGWVKDGDYNTRFSKTVGPLPLHDHPNYERPDYEAPAGALDLEHDPAYLRHPKDWQTYHTRFATPRDFLSGLR
jgi:tetratricopeptide (TPR) repeat protein